MKPGTRIRAQRSDSIRGEAAWVPHSFAELEQVRRVLLEAGQTTVVVNGLTGWLVSKALGEDDVSSSQTRSTYRKILAGLGPSPLPPRGGDHVDREAGLADLRRSSSTAALAMVGAGATALASAGNLWGAVLALALGLPPIMLDEGGYVGCELEELEAA